MILSNGKLYKTAEQNEVLAGLEEVINEVRSGTPLDINGLEAALERISSRIASGEFDHLIEAIDPDNAGMYKAQAVQMLQKPFLEYRVSHELRMEMNEPHPAWDGGNTGLYEKRVPLGTIFHIAAGNADVLPAYSLIEGLMCGNINILKLPEADGGLTVMLLKLLTDAFPEAAGYVHVFDTPSADIDAMIKMAQMSDAVSVWGGDAAVRAVRQMAPVGIPLIEWGHRLSFCYISGTYTGHTEELQGLAEHIMSTKQLLCSSCQIIYLDTDKMEELDDFAKYFLNVLEKAAERHENRDPGAAAEQTLRRRTDHIERILRELEGDGSGEAEERKRIGESGCSLTICKDSELELSELWGNVLVKRLPAESLMQVLRKGKGYLQTAGLIAGDNREELADTLIRCGVNRVLPPAEMSYTFPGESHDGIYPFERYTRVVNYKL